MLLSACALAAALRADGAGGAEERPVSETALRQRVQQLAGELDADARAVRDAAQESLLRLGPSILPLLPEEDRVSHAAARDALRRIRQRLERQSALDSLKPSRVTLRGTMALRDILGRFAAQTGNAFDLAQLPEADLRRAFTVDENQALFWAACDDLMARAGLAYGQSAERGRLKLVPGAQASAQELIAVGSDALRVAADVATARRSLTDPSRQSLRIGWSLMAEPRLRPLYARIALRELIVRGPDGKLLQPVSPDAKLELAMGDGGKALRLHSDFQIPAEIEPATVEFRGVVRVEMAAGPRRIVFDDLRPGRSETKRVGSVTVRLQKVGLPAANAKRGSLRVEVAVVYDQGGPAFESYRTWIYHNDAALETQNGRRLAPEPLFATRQQGDGSLAVEYNFAHAIGEPSEYRFVYVAPTLITELPVVFHFPKIPVTRSTEEGTRR